MTGPASEPMAPVAEAVEPMPSPPGTSSANGPKVRRTSTTLADGRELIYFDDSEPYRSGARRRDAADDPALGVRTAFGIMRPTH